MGSAVIVIMSPGFGDPPGFKETPEPVLVQALLPEAPVEALAGAVLHGLSGLDEVVPTDIFCPNGCGRMIKNQVCP